MRRIVLGLCLFASLYAIAGKDRKDIPSAPLPAIVVNAKKVFLTNGGGSNLAYDRFYADMKQWGKYEIVGSPDDADLIVDITLNTTEPAFGVQPTPTTAQPTSTVLRS